MPTSAPARQPGAEQRLHHIRHIGADHQQFAVRHIDDAHQAEGDGQPQRSQQQHAAQADAVEKVARPFDGGQVAVDPLQGVGGGFAHAGIGFGVYAALFLRQRGKRGAEGGIAGGAQQFDGMAPLGRVGALQFQIGLRDQQRVAHGLVLFGCQRFFQHGQTGGIAARPRWRGAGGC
ncbi:hypothetical protein G6F65_020131 [Rhizopus arrhizus]|nr:hypothetical protein G6F65_020131 [Rhizopus arrhizus]